MSAAAKAVKSKAERIRDWLKANPDGGRCGEIAGALDLSSNEVSMSLSDLHRREDVVRCKVEVPGKQPEYHYRLSAKSGSPRQGQPWRTMTVVGAAKPPRPEATTRPRGEAPVPATVLPAVQAVAREQDAIEASRETGEACSGAPAPVVDERTPPALGDTLRKLERTVDPDAPLARPREEAIAKAAAEAVRQHRDETAARGAPRFALYSDGTLILEALPNLPPVVAIRRDHAAQLMDYLRSVSA